MASGWKYVSSFVASSLIVAALMFGINFYTVQERESAQRWVHHAYDVIDQVQDFSISFERTLSAQRGIIITNNSSLQDEFENSYETHKEKLSNGVVTLAKLTADNQDQVTNVSLLQQHLSKYLTLLDLHINSAGYNQAEAVGGSNSVAVDDLRKQVRQQLDVIYKTEQIQLKNRLSYVEDITERNRLIVLVASLVSFLFFMLINILAYQSTLRSSQARRDLADISERYTLALQGTSDGLFDWDIAAKTMYYSPRFLQMQGYSDEDDIAETPEFLKSHIHPEDKDNVLKHVQDYLDGEISTYSIVYRLRHKEGHYLWINSRGKALHDINGKAIRLVGAHTDISPLKSIEAQLITEKEQAVKADEAKTNFLAHISHEIRTPLNVIINVSKILNNKKVLKGDDEVLLTTLNDSAVALMDLINDFLDVSKIESGELSLENRPFALEKTLRQVSNMMTVKAHEKGLAFTLNYENTTDTPTIYSDRLRIRQILLNLINNAIKFTPKGSVTLNAVVNTDAINIQVIDTGIGISEEFQQSIFEKFTQADASVARLYGGSGLGLNISARLAELLGGKLTVTSEEGVGSTFTLALPNRIAPQTDMDKPLSPSVDVGLVDSDDVTQVPHKKILVAEDYDGNIMILKYYLDNIGVSYDIAKNGEEALNLYKNSEYHLALMDIQMPVMDGIEATQCIRLVEKDSRRDSIPIIAMTAHALTGDEARCRNAGMTDYLTKPLQEDDLITLLIKHDIIQGRPVPTHTA